MASPKTPVGLLQEMCVAQKWIPIYELTNAEGSPHCMTYEMTVLIRRIDKNASGSAKTKMAAKHNAAQVMLDILKESHPDLFSTSTPETQSPADAGLEENFIGKLQNYCIDNIFDLPDYDKVSESGEPHEKTFTYECKLQGQITIGEGRSKKLAKKLAARRMLEVLAASAPAPVATEDDDTMTKLNQDLSALVQ